MTTKSELKPIIELLTIARDDLAKSFQMLVDTTEPTERLLLDLMNESIQKTEFVLNRLENIAFRDEIARKKANNQGLNFDERGRTIL